MGAQEKWESPDQEEKWEPTGDQVEFCEILTSQGIVRGQWQVICEKIDAAEGLQVWKEKGPAGIAELLSAIFRIKEDKQGEE